MGLNNPCREGHYSLSKGQELIANWLIGYVTKVTCYKDKGKVLPKTGHEDPEGE